MFFCCTRANSSKRQKSKRPLDSPTSISYATIPSASMPRSDSGFSDTSSTRQLTISIEQLINLEKTYCQNLKQCILNYSRPLRRYLNSDEIVDLFQNIEKICSISESLVRQCERSLDVNHLLVYQSWSTMMVDAYCSYVRRIQRAQTTLDSCKEKISYFLQMPIELIVNDIDHFLMLPLRHICLLDRCFRSLLDEHSDLRNAIDQTFINDLKLITGQATKHMEPHIYNDYASSEDLTLLSEISSVVVLKRTNKQHWEPKRLEILNSRLLFSAVDRPIITSSICLSNVLHLQEDEFNHELRLIVVNSPAKMSTIHLKFEHDSNFRLWIDYLNNGIQQAKDQTWKNNNELVI